MKKRRKRRKRQIKSIKKRNTEVLGLKIPLFMLPVLIILAVATIFLTIEAATEGAKLANLEQESRELARKNQLLEAELVSSSSLSELGEKAEELGFQKPANVVYISKEEAVARLP